MTEQEVRRYLRQMKEEDSERAFHSFYNLCYDRLFRIACYFVKHEEWAQEIVLDVFMKLWEQRARLPEVNNIEDYCFILTKNASLNYLEKENRHPTLSSEQLPEVSGQADSPEDTLISEELFARYVKALDLLKDAGNFTYKKKTTLLYLLLNLTDNDQLYYLFAPPHQNRTSDVCGSFKRLTPCTGTKQGNTYKPEYP